MIPKWEYMIANERYEFDRDTLDVLGEAGWELCSVIYDNIFYTYYFKRLKE
jgi:hypothetical protein